MIDLPQPSQLGLNWDTLAAIVQTTAVLLSLPAAAWLLSAHMKTRRRP